MKLGFILMKYKQELIRSMNWLSKKKDTIFLGQSVNYTGNAIFNTLKEVDQKRLNYLSLKNCKWEYQLEWH